MKQDQEEGKVNSALDIVKQSLLGLIAIVAAVSGALLIFISWFTSFVLKSYITAYSREAIGYTTFYIGLLLVYLGFIVSVIALFRKKEKRIIAIVAIIISVTTWLIIPLLG